MAKRKNSSGANQAMPSSPMGGGSGRISVSIEPAENGSIVHCSSEGDGKNREYQHKTFVAPSHASAIRIAAQHIHSMNTKGKAKHKAGKRKASVKKSL